MKSKPQIAVHVYAVVRIRVKFDQEFGSDAEAMNEAEKVLFGTGLETEMTLDDGTPLDSSYAEEITGFLVDHLDEDGDVTSSVSYDANGYVDGYKPYSVTILWGEHPEPDQEPVTYSFGTKKELDAFMEGVNSADGWLGCEIIGEDDGKD